MNIRDMLHQLDAVQPTVRGWMARCPAHHDRRPSLSIGVADDGRVLLHCFAGCTFHDIHAALNIPGQSLSSRLYDTPNRAGSRVGWRRHASDLAHHALLRWLRGEAVLAFAINLDTSAWTETDYDAALDAVARAYSDLERAQLLEDLAFSIRCRHLAEEHLARASRR